MSSPQFIFIDTEFTDLLDPHLISIGLITEDGKNELYLERNDYDKSTSSPFVKVAVEPLFQTKGFPLHEISAKLFHWLAMLPGKYQIICDYYTDWELFIDVVENLPPNIEPQIALLYAELDTRGTMHGMKTGTILETCVRARNAFHMGMEDYFFTNKLPHHHALYDAKANRYGWLMASSAITTTI